MFVVELVRSIYGSSGGVKTAIDLHFTTTAAL